MKKMLAAVLCCTLLLLCIPAWGAAADLPLRVVVNGDKVSFPEKAAEAFREADGTVYVTTDFLQKYLSVTVTQTEDTYIIKDTTRTVKLIAGESYYEMNGKRQELTAPSIKRPPYLFVPLQTFWQAFGQKYEWDAAVETSYLTFEKATESEAPAVPKTPEPSVAPADAAKWDSKYAEANGNMANWGNAASDGKYHYYVKAENNNTDTLFRYDTQTRKTKKLLNTKSIYNLMFVDDWIYYLGTTNYRNDAYDIYKIKKDGTNKSKVTNMTNLTRFMYIDNGWIYFSYWNKDNNLYKMKLNGTSLTRLSSQPGVSRINIWGDWVFFEGERQLFKVNKDGKNEKLISPAERYFITAGGKIYLGGFDGDLSKVSTDGTSFEQSFLVAEDAYGMPDITAVNMRGEYIYYYEKDDNRIIRVNRNGTGKSSFVTLLTDYSVNTINIAGNWMYYDAVLANGPGGRITQRNLYRIELKSGNKPELIYSIRV
ncbi:hypothetical protein GCM10010912_09530 [Paenibacillus albidus]|uniref:DUF5050 domain-containing protein n=1 Tax=Paenibacillus albidus TaxID=2041023 RepID=A0A917C0W7_9BACL|nr:DUF5050 domain-containing protein [Paenibacillus albidus]GGF66634.1 hypothetical protein GCM10010912_09530 [Paenibacillus albidus]